MVSMSTSLSALTPSRTASSCIAATTSRASRTIWSSIALTVVDRPGWATTSPLADRRSNASRTGVRLTPSHSASSPSLSCSPGAKVPSTMASRRRP
jgi:hypothetical protein